MVLNIIRLFHWYLLQRPDPSFLWLMESVIGLDAELASRILTRIPHQLFLALRQAHVLLQAAALAWVP